MLRHFPVWSGKNEKLQGTRYEKQFENQVNWIKENNILLNFKWASVKNSTYRPNTAMFPNIMKKPETIIFKGLSQYPIMSLRKNNLIMAWFQTLPNRSSDSILTSSFYFIFCTLEQFLKQKILTFWFLSHLLKIAPFVLW